MGKGVAEAEKKNTEGWTDVTNARKRHYFITGRVRSLCGQWYLWSHNVLELGNDDNPENCKTCRKKLEKRKKL